LPEGQMHHLKSIPQGMDFTKNGGFRRFFALSVE
jgi:hypothetical protein